MPLFAVLLALGLKVDLVALMDRAYTSELAILLWQR